MIETSAHCMPSCITYLILIIKIVEMNLDKYLGNLKYQKSMKLVEISNLL